MNAKRRFLLRATATLLAAASLSGAAAADTKVKVGVLNDMSGVYADLAGPDSLVAVGLAVEDFGAATKGISVEVVGGDHQNKADIGANLARQWFDQDGVDLIVDVPNSAVALAVSAVAKEKNKILVVSAGGSSDLTGKACNANTIHWTYDTWALAHGTGTALTKQGYDTWFFLSADYAFGQALERDTTEAVVQAGGKVLGSVKHPFPGSDFSSYLLQAQSSGAKVIGLANAGGDTINSI
jgi:branched-chain amino acid transport system substrate-binding protein